jgi:uncharacterized protein (DUF1778 family)
MAQPSAQKIKKDNRIELRVKPEEKMLLERAAELNGANVSAFMLGVALRAARRHIAETENLMLSDQDRDLFLAALDSPPKPSAALKKAMRRLQKQG